MCHSLRRVGHSSVVTRSLVSFEDCASNDFLAREALDSCKRIEGLLEHGVGSNCKCHDSHDTTSVSRWCRRVDLKGPSTRRTARCASSTSWGVALGFARAFWPIESCLLVFDRATNCKSIAAHPTQLGSQRRRSRRESSTGHCRPSRSRTEVRV